MDAGPILALPLLDEGLELSDRGRDVGHLLRALLPEVLLQAPNSQEPVQHGLRSVCHLTNNMSGV